MGRINTHRRAPKYIFEAKYPTGMRVGLGCLAVFVVLVILSANSHLEYHKIAFNRRRSKLYSSWKKSSVFVFSDNVSSTHPQVLKYISDFHVYPPPSEGYQLDHRPSGPPLDIRDVVGEKENGFFIECGANDGEFLSNTLGFETFFNWTGLLVESSPSLFEKLKTKHRKAWISDACLSGKIERIDFLKSRKTDYDWRIGNGKINHEGRYAKPKNGNFRNEAFKMENYISEGIVECFPIHSILLALNVTRVDFFSLDVEGHEYQILKAIPFDKIDIKVLFVEYWLAPEGGAAIHKLMTENGFTLVFQSTSDFIFKKI